MKKEVIFIFIFLFLISAVSAVEIQMKSNFSAGETLIAKVSGNFQNPLSADNVLFYRGHVNIPLIYNVGKFNEDYYIYAILPESPEISANYSILLKNIRYIEGSQISDNEIQKNFLISQEKADFSVNPGFVITKTDFSINVQNLGDNQIDLSVKVKKETKESEGFFSSLFGSATETETTIPIKSGEIKKIDLELEDFNQSTFEIIELSTKSLIYEIPVYVIIDTSDVIEPEILPLMKFRFEPLNTNISLAVNSKKNKTISIYNNGEAEIKDIALTVPDGFKQYISLSRYKIDRLGINSSTDVEIYITSGKEKQIIEGKLSATNAKGDIIYFPIVLNFLKASEEIPKDVDTYIVIKKCSELKGIVCKSGETCSGKEETASDGKCCIGKCEVAKSGMNLKVIGFVLIFVVLGILYWLFVRTFSKERKKKKMAEDIVKILGKK